MFWLELDKDFFAIETGSGMKMPTSRKLNLSCCAFLYTIPVIPTILHADTFDELSSTKTIFS